MILPISSFLYLCVLFIQSGAIALAQVPQDVLSPKRPFPQESTVPGISSEEWPLTPPGLIGETEDSIRSTLRDLVDALKVMQEE